MRRNNSLKLITLFSLFSIILSFETFGQKECYAGHFQGIGGQRYIWCGGENVETGDPDNPIIKYQVSLNSMYCEHLAHFSAAAGGSQIEFFHGEGPNGEAAIGLEAYFMLGEVSELFHSRYGRNGIGSSTTIKVGENMSGSTVDGSSILIGEFIDGPALCFDFVAALFARGIYAQEKSVNNPEAKAIMIAFGDVFATASSNFSPYHSGDQLRYGDEFPNQVLFQRKFGAFETEGYPIRYKGANWEFDNESSRFWHKNASVIDFWFYSLANGKAISIDGVYYKVESLGWDKMERFFYSIVNDDNYDFFDFKSFKLSTLDAAVKQFGACSFEYLQILKMWEVVGVETGNLCGWVERSLTENSAAEVHLDSYELDCPLTNTVNEPVRLFANNFIKFKPGFSVENNFHAGIEVCDLNSSEFLNEDDLIEKTSTNVDSESSIFRLVDEIKVYPNPVNDRLFIDGVESGTYSILDAQGREVLKGEVANGIAIDTKELNEGMFILRVKTNSGVGSRVFLK